MRAVDRSELVKHASEESCWIVIEGYVYDITNFKSHPGGFNRIFQFGGQDATREFQAVRHHSAHQYMASMLVGRLARGREGSPTDGEAEVEEDDEKQPQASRQHVVSFAPEQPAHIRALTGGFRGHRTARPGDPMWSTRCRGFLPSRDPLVKLERPVYAVLHELCELMPAALADGSFRSLVEQNIERFRPIAAAIEAEEGDGSEEVLERVHALYGYIGKGYVHGSAADAKAPLVVPDFLAAGWLTAADRIGRHPTIDYADCVLNNWQRIDPKGGITPENIRLLHRFTGLLDEEWFLKTHVIIESEAAGVISAIYDGYQAVQSRDIEALLRSLSWMEQAMSHVASNCLRIMFDRRDEAGGAGGTACCDPFFFFHRFRPYISSWSAVFEGQYEEASKAKCATLTKQLEMLDALEAEGPEGLPTLTAHRSHLRQALSDLQKRQSLCGPSGAMSTLLPMCDAFLEISMSSDELGTMLAKFEQYMPAKHREALAAVRSNPARSFVLQLREHGCEQALTLVDHFNACVRRVLDFRWRHLSYIEEYVVRPRGMADARGTGGTPAFEYLNQHISDTEAALIPLLDPPLDDASDGAGHARAEGLSGTGVPLLLPERAIGLRDGASLDESRRSVEDALAQIDDIWLVTEHNGLLPPAAPLGVEALPISWQPLIALLLSLPAACVPPATYCDAVEARAGALPADLSALTGRWEEERARALVSFIVAGWHAAAKTNGKPRSPPEPLARLAALLSARLGRAAGLDMIDTILYNWRLRGVFSASPLTTPRGGEAAAGPDGTSDSRGTGAPALPAALAAVVADHGRSRSLSDSPQLVGLAGPASPFDRTARPVMATMPHVVPVQRFLCVEEEDWFVRLHVTLASEFGRVVGAARACLGAQSVDARQRSLQQLEQAIEVLVKVHYEAGIGSMPGKSAPNVRPVLLQQRMAHFYDHVPEIGLEPLRQRAARIYCATGVDQSCLLHLLGVECDRAKPHAMQTFREWQESATMPEAHRAYLAELRRTAHPMRDVVEKEVGVRKLTVQQLARLELAHNNCIDMLLRYFTRRWELVRMMFGEEASRHLTFDWEQERACIAEARLRLLVHRRALAAGSASPESQHLSRVSSTASLPVTGGTGASPGSAAGTGAEPQQRPASAPVSSATSGDEEEEEERPLTTPGDTADE